MFASLGKTHPDKYFEDLLNEAPGAMNFTMFLTMFGEKLQGTDPEDVIKNAFGCFDEENTGKRAFINYVDRILPIINHLPPPVDIFEGIPYTEIRENLHIVDISSTP